MINGSSLLIRTLFLNTTIESWKRKWSLQREGRHTQSIFPLPCSKPPNPIPCRKVDIMLNRLRSGHSLLAEHSYKMKIALSPNCVCGKDKGTIHHFLLHCPIDHQAREVLSHKIEMGYVNTNTRISPQTRFVQRHEEHDEQTCSQPVCQSPAGTKG